jgi:hypothetical protein
MNADMDDQQKRGEARQRQARILGAVGDYLQPRGVGRQRPSRPRPAQPAGLFTDRNQRIGTEER